LFELFESCASFENLLIWFCFNFMNLRFLQPCSFILFEFFESYNLLQLFSNILLEILSLRLFCNLFLPSCLNFLNFIIFCHFLFLFCLSFMNLRLSYNLFLLFCLNYHTLKHHCSFINSQRLWIQTFLHFHFALKKKVGPSFSSPPLSNDNPPKVKTHYERVNLSNFITYV
jgi:hypothetical protein